MNKHDLVCPSQCRFARADLTCFLTTLTRSGYPWLEVGLVPAGAVFVVVGFSLTAVIGRLLHDDDASSPYLVVDCPALGGRVTTMRTETLRQSSPL